MAGATMKLAIDSDTDVMDHVVTVEYSESLDEIDCLSVLMSLESQSDTTAVVALLEPGKPYKVDLMSGSSPANSGEGDLIEVQHRLKPGGRHEVALVGVDRLHRLTYGAPQAKLWEASHSDIVTEIANRNGLTPEADGVDTTAGFEFQYDTSDAVFLKQLARHHNYYLRVDAQKLKFSRRQGSGNVVVDATSDLIELRLRASLSGVVTEVTVHGSDYLQDEIFTETATASHLQKISDGRTGVAIAQQALGAVPLVLNQTGLGTATAVTAVAKAELQRRAERFIQGTVVVTGRPDAISGSTLEIQNASWPFAGKFLIRQTRHLYDIGSGYRTSIDFCSDAFPAP